MTIYRITVAITTAVKGPIEELLRTRSEAEPTAEGLTIGQIIRALDLNKTRAGDVAAALIKMRNEGKVIYDTGPATSATGPRFVKRYRWRRKAKASAMDDRRYLSLQR